MVAVDGRSFGTSRVAQLEPFCDFLRRFAPTDDEALPAQEGGVPLSASPPILTLSQLGEACGAGVRGACHAVVYAKHEAAWEPVLARPVQWHWQLSQTDHLSVCW